MPVMPSPAVRRAARVLTVLASGPEKDLSLSEVARRAGLNKTSCQTLLLAMVADGLVARRETSRTYRLGPGLIRLGEAAKASLDFAELVDPELTALRDELGVTTMAGVVTGTDVVVTSVRTADHPLGLTVVPGHRVPLRAPVGPIYVAWAGEDAIERWLSRAEPGPTRADRQRYRQTVAEIRRRGYSATIRRSVSTNGRGATAGGARTIHAEYIEVAGDDDATYSVVGMSAPVFDANGDLVCTIALSTLPDDLLASEIRVLGGRLRSSAERVMGRLGGRWPGADIEIRC
jgi:DNA-binding IclR family transcriptional regulator